MFNHILYPLATASGIVLAAALVNWLCPVPPCPEISRSRLISVSFANTFVTLFCLSFLPPATYSNFHDHSVAWCVFSSLLYLVGTDALLWGMHYCLHTRFLYSKVHYYHHQIKEPSAFAFGFVHPVEMLLPWALLFVGPFLFPVYWLTFWVYAGILGIIALLEHGDGLKLIPFLNDRDYHNLHHTRSSANFGIGLFSTWWDKLAGCYVPSTKSS